LGFEKVERMLSRNLLEIAPLAYMRGRTLSEASIILDEAQNTTVEQMKMFLTRLGEGSRVVVSGDVTQVDLPANRRSGLAHAVEVLQRVEGISFIRFTHRDVVRHPLVRRIVQAYEEAAALENHQTGRLA
ncbi:MAG: PhoH family protein, partial [Magnetococcales bacterium]|nr:PhoH family protein [Magnetococcales bacterium]